MLTGVACWETGCDTWPACDMSRGVTELVTADMDTDITDSEPEFRLPGVPGPAFFISEEEERGSVA